MPYFVQYDEITNKYSAKKPGTDLVGEGGSLYAAIDNLEAKMDSQDEPIREPEVSIRIKGEFSRTD